MGRRGGAIVALAAALVALTATPAHAGCGLAGLFPCPPASGTEPATSRALELSAEENPHGLTELPARGPGDPLYPRIDGHVPYGITDNRSGGSDAEALARAPALLAGMGASLVRVSLHWPTVEPEKGAYRFTYTDALYRAYIAAGVRPVFLIVHTPKWATDPLEAVGKCLGNTCFTEPDPDHVGSLWRLGNALTYRYPLMGGLEYRNEPNIYSGKRRPIDPARYVRALSRLTGGAREARPSVRIWGGALAMAANLEDYTAALLRNDAAAHMDGLSFHPYDVHQPYAQMRWSLDPIAAAFDSVGEGDLRLIAGEFGASDLPTSLWGPDVDFADGDEGTGQETTFARLSAQYRDIDTAGSDADPPIPLIDRVDAALMFSAFEVDAGHHSHGIGWTRPAADGRLEPKHVWCAWRTEIARLPHWTGDADLAACP